MIPFFRDPVPYLTADQMREVDRLMIEVYHIELIQMMENAGRNLAHLARTRFLHDDPQGKHIIVLAGTGGNGGGALVCARWLHTAGAMVRVYLTADLDRLTPIPAQQLDILLQIHIAVARANQIETERVPDLIVDGIIGYSLNGSPRGDAAKLINWANASGAPILALDVPSGLDASTGRVFDPSIQAAATMTLALPKEGLQSEIAHRFVGELYLANIGVPSELYAQSTVGLKVENIFRQSDLVRLR